MDDADDVAARTAETMYSTDAASQMLGMEIVAVAPGSATLRMEVAPEMINGLDVCHGGIIFSLADSAMAFASNSRDDVSFAVSADMTWLRPARRGDVLTATAHEAATAGRNGVYDVEVHSESGELLAVFRGRVRATGRRLLDPQPGS